METINYFEALDAPTSSDSKLIVEYSRAAPNLEPNQKTKFRQELQNPSSRLYSELTTVRIEETYPGDGGTCQKAQVESDRRRYLEYFTKLTGSKAEPIDHAYAGNWFKKLMTVIPDPNASNMKRLASKLKREDPWLLQGLAACVLRIAINSEASEDPNTAAGVWKLAIELYRSFFSTKQLQNSYTHIYSKNNEEALEKCRTYWESFFISLIDDMVNRINGYLAGNNYRALNCCVEVLNANFKDEEETIKIKNLYDHILSDFSKKVQNCTQITSAELFYDNCPETIRKRDIDCKLQSAMVVAMTTESASIAAGRANIDNIEIWLSKLKMKTIEKKVGMPDVKKNWIHSIMEFLKKFVTGHWEEYQMQTQKVNETILNSKMKGFYTEVANQIRIKLNTEDDQHPCDAYEIIRLIDLLPADFSVGKLPDHTDLTARQAKTNRIIGILNNLMEADVELTSTIEAIKRFRRYQLKNTQYIGTENAGKDMTLEFACDRVYTNIFISCVNEYGKESEVRDKPRIVNPPPNKESNKSNKIDLMLPNLSYLLAPYTNPFRKENVRELALTVAGFFPYGKRIENYTLAELFPHFNATYPSSIIQVTVE